MPGLVVWRQSATAASETPPTRDRVVDLLRVGSLLVVVLGHILMVIVRWDGDRPRIANLLAEVPSLDLATWLLQVMPVFFAAGAIANRTSSASADARGDPWRVWVWHRVRRLLRPVVYYLAIWSGIVVVFDALAPETAGKLARLSTQLLWFLGAYLLVIATIRWQVALARRGFAPVLTLLALVGLTDLARFHLLGSIAISNFFTVWFATATLGLVMRDHVAAGTAAARRSLALLGAGALALNVALVATLPYPESMVGMPGERISNMAPPTIVLALHAVVLVCAVGLLWPRFARWCARPGVWRFVVAGGAMAMTVYLWHLTALLGVVEAEHLLGITRGVVDGPGFWMTTAVHLVVALAAVALLVAFVVPFEHLPVPWFERPRPHTDDRPRWTALAAVAVVLCGVGLLALSATGMGGFASGRFTTYGGIPLTPEIGMAVLALGALLSRMAGSRTPPVSAPPVGQETTR